MSEFENENSAESQTPGVGEYNEEAGEAAFASPEGKMRNNAPMIFLGLLLVGAGAIYFMRMRSGPSAASASVEATAAKETISKFLTEGDKNMLAMKELLRNTEKIVQQFLNYPSMTQVKLEDLKTNPFRFAKPAEDTAAADAAAAEAKRLEAEKQATLAAVQKLKLQSILSGRNPSCMINNKMCAEGQEVEGFRIEQISPGGIVVSRGTYKFELTILK